MVAVVLMVITVAPVAADTDLIIGDKAIVSYTNGDGVNFRDAVGFSANVITALPEGASVVVIGGPLTADDGTHWYNVNLDGQLGWIVSDYLSRPVASSGDTATVVNTDGHGLRLRDGPDRSAGTITVMPEGATLSVVGDEVTDGSGNAWAHVSYNGATGYAFRGYLSLAAGAATATAAAVVEEAAPSGLAVGQNAEVVDTGGAGLRLRYDAGFDAGVATVAAEGHVVQIIDGPRTDASGNTWWGVDYRGVSGWMYGRYLAVTDREATQAGSSTAQSSTATVSAPAASATGERIAAFAMQFLGYPYVWGGTTPSGFDCSGFTFYVVNQVLGGGFPRSLAAQAGSGVYVDPSNLQPGDIVFQQNTYKWGLSHVGIYIGNGQFIHAATPSVGVVISNLWDSYWSPRYYTARRIG